MSIDIKYEDIVDVYFSDGLMHITIKDRAQGHGHAHQVDLVPSYDEGKGTGRHTPTPINTYTGECFT